MNKLFQYLIKPELYAKSTDAFWDNEHISKGMLAAHLNTENDGATRKIDFVRQSVNWIKKHFPAEKHPNLLDLGCGPGIYAQLFHAQGYKVTGVDFSQRSIAYAIEQSKQLQLDINYHYMDYLTMSFQECFDFVTLIWCDYGALAPEARKTLLRNIHAALKPEGVLLLDVFSHKQYEEREESKTFSYHPDGGFWSPEQHLCLNSLYKYPQHIALEQAVVITKEKVDCFNIWEHYFTSQELIAEVTGQGFEKAQIFADLTGQAYSPDSKTICLAAQKE